MKTTFIYTMIFSCFFLFSACSEDDSPAETSEVQAKLQGKWLFEGLTIDGIYEDSAAEDGEVYYDFRAGGVLVLMEDAGSITGTYKVVGNDVTVRMEGEVATFKVTKLTTSELDLFANIDADEESGLDEVTFHFAKN